MKLNINFRYVKSPSHDAQRVCVWLFAWLSN